MIIDYGDYFDPHVNFVDLKKYYELEEAVEPPIELPEKEEEKDEQ